MSPPPGSASRRCFLCDARHLPRAPLPETGVTRLGVVSRTPSEGVTPPSSLLRAHAPHHPPLPDFGVPYTMSLCRLRRAPAGRWWFPTLSPPSVHRRLDPYPVATSRCTYPFLPGRQRPHVTFDTFGSRDDPCQATSTGKKLRGCSHSVLFRLPCLLDPQVAPTASFDGQPGRLRHAMNLRLPSGTVISLRA